jgi:uroporphyrin-III C-methyltransferase
MKQSKHPGWVYLVGAGPGDPELITVKGLRCLQAADVIVYDRLVSPLLLDEACPEAERIFAGKEAGCHTLAQEEINMLLIAHARRGRMVVRLKGGDPFLFGRGGEEAAALAEAGIPFEVVPGVTSAIAVPAYAGIPVTYRGLAAQVTIVTAHGGDTRPSAPVNWEQLATQEGTLVILMGLAALPHITRRLLVGGMAPLTPAAVIQQGTLQSQRVVTGTLADIATKTVAAQLSSPALIVIGAVAALRDSLDWFESGSASSYERLLAQVLAAVPADGPGS